MYIYIIFNVYIYYVLYRYIIYIHIMINLFYIFILLLYVHIINSMHKL